MFLTNILLKKAKSKRVLVSIKSVATGHMRNQIRERTADKIETVFFDPWVQAMSVYKEVRKIKSI
ncbi:mitochondrial ribosomal protein L33 [Osmia lignaria lignaria]|uniref:mitochondrial ribosomal protein L33 n=1 Tax=Osmia lignaria lignaria TaxID=1437193 RepID=UPI0014781428|nr:39S ribosomal protein L33, mitochondrial [Osmia lignaria]